MILSSMGFFLFVTLFVRKDIKAFSYGYYSYNISREGDIPPKGGIFLYYIYFYYVYIS